MPNKKLPMRPPGNTPGEDYLAARYDKITLRLPREFSSLLRGLAEKQDRNMTAIIVEALCRQHGWAMPKDKRRGD